MAANMKSIYFVAGLFVMLVQGSWQRSLQDTEEKSSLLPAAQADSLTDQHQIHKEKRDDEEWELSEDQIKKFSELDVFLESECLQDFLNWLLLNDKFLDNIPEMVLRRHVDGSFSDEMNAGIFPQRNL